MSWRPNASLEVLKARAELYGSVRAFFSARGVLEVETPVLSAHATVDRHIESFETRNGRWLQTSPEFAMKRLLAAGSGPIWQLCKVFRLEEQGRHHNPEFTMLEWYRPGFDHQRLMDEVAQLLAAVGLPAMSGRLSYREAFQKFAGLDAFTASEQELRAAARSAGYSGVELERDGWLDVMMSLRVAPALGLDAPCFLYDFPASQAALARVNRGVAQRFELFWRGLELANGFYELTDAAEQERRFEADQLWRQQHGLKQPPYDRNLIDALRSGLTDCAGVALGMDRLLMLKLGLPELASTLSFAADRS